MARKGKDLFVLLGERLGGGSKTKGGQRGGSRADTTTDEPRAGGFFRGLFRNVSRPGQSPTRGGRGPGRGTGRGGRARVPRGLLLPGWTVALMGGVGGTLTVLCYGYWIREKGRSGSGDLTACRIDLAVCYAMTALFGLAMVVIGSTIEVEGRGAGLVVSLADKLAEQLGSVGRWAFLLGAFGAVFSSLLGVWQAVPYIFADFWRIIGSGHEASADAPRSGVDTRARPYRGYLFAIAFVPMLGLFFGFRDIQRVYAVFGALFMPLLAVTLLLLNGRSDWVGHRFRNRPLTTALLTGTVALFLYFGYRQLRAQLGA